MTQSIYIPRGVNTEALSRTASWDYQPEGFKVCFVELTFSKMDGKSKIPLFS